MIEHAGIYRKHYLGSPSRTFLDAKVGGPPPSIIPKFKCEYCGNIYKEKEPEQCTTCGANEFVQLTGNPMPTKQIFLSPWGVLEADEIAQAFAVARTEGEGRRSFDQILEDYAEVKFTGKKLGFSVEATPPPEPSSDTDPSEPWGIYPPGYWKDPLFIAAMIVLVLILISL